MSYNPNPAKITDCSYNNEESLRCKLPMATYTLCKYHYYVVKKGRKHKWTTEEDRANIVKLYISGLSSQKVADKFGVSKQTVLTIVTRAGLVRSHEKGQGTKYILGENYKPTGGFARKLHSSVAYRKLRRFALDRANNQCQICSSQHKLHLDHVKPKSLFPELALNKDNVRILCQDCHINTDSYGGKIFKRISVA
jgi:hypothetical protein